MSAISADGQALSCDQWRRIVLVDKACGGRRSDERGGGVSSAQRERVCSSMAVDGRRSSADAQRSFCNGQRCEMIGLCEFFAGGCVMRFEREE